MKKFLHKLSHLFGTYRGRVVTLRINGEDSIYVGFRCDQCSDILDIEVIDELIDASLASLESLEYSAKLERSSLSS